MTYLMTMGGITILHAIFPEILLSSVVFRGLGYNWTETSIEYVIGLTDGDIEGSNMDVILPYDGWECVSGRTEKLAEIYDVIYKNGPLTYEIEMFDDDGNCKIMFYR